MIKKQLASYVRLETPMEQAGLRKVRVREQIASVSEPWDGQ
jgi:hypothetical protein